MQTLDTLRAKALERLEQRVTRHLLGRFRRHVPEVLILRAVAEAREAADRSGWTLLALPILAEEMAARLKVFAESPAYACAA